MNDTIAGEPLMTVPLNVRNRTGVEVLSLCYQVNGAAGKYFNLVSDRCVSVNAHYAAVESSRRFIIDSIAIRAVDNLGQCKNISVGVQECRATVNNVQVPFRYSSGGISIRVYPSRRVRISVPNCADVNLVMWVHCLNAIIDSLPVQMIRFVIARGFNLDETSHGILGRSVAAIQNESVCMPNSPKFLHYIYLCIVALIQVM